MKKRLNTWKLKINIYIQSLIFKTTTMKLIKIATAFLFICISTYLPAQEKEDKLFKDNQPLDIALKVSIKEVKDNTGDTIYIADQLSYRNSKGSFDSVKAELKARGKFRLARMLLSPIENQDAESRYPGNRV